MGEGADLRALNCRAPFLLEHRKYLEDLLGSTEEAWIEDDRAYAIVRFADLPLANQVWSLLEQGFPIGASIGYEILSCRPVEIEGATEGATAWVVDAWRAFEVSAAVIVNGVDVHAGIVHRPFTEFAQLQSQRRAARLGLERAARIEALEAGRWRASAKMAGPISSPLLSACRRESYASR